MKSPFGWSHQGPQKQQVENNPLAQPLFRRNVEERDFEPGQLEYVRRGYEPYTDTDSGQYALADGSGNVIYFCDTSSGDVTVTLPSAGASVGTMFKVKRTTGGVNNLNVTATTGNIDGTATVGIATQYTCLQIVSDGENWWIV